MSSEGKLTSIIHNTWYFPGGFPTSRFDVADQPMTRNIIRLLLAVPCGALTCGNYLRDGHTKARLGGNPEKVTTTINTTAVI